MSPLEEMVVDGVEVEELRWVTPEEILSIQLYSECIAALEKFLSLKK